MNQNVGHGHVFGRPDGVRARCGGPGFCAECSRDLARHKAGLPREEEVAPPSNERVSPHVKWLLDVASHLHAERRTAFANTCEQAAAELLAVSRHRDTLLAAHEARQPDVRAPLPPDVLVDAHMERVHQDTGISRPGRSVRANVTGEPAALWMCQNCKSENRDDYHRISCPGCGQMRPGTRT